MVDIRATFLSVGLRSDAKVVDMIQQEFDKRLEQVYSVELWLDINDDSYYVESKLQEQKDKIKQILGSKPERQDQK